MKTFGVENYGSVDNLQKSTTKTNHPGSARPLGQVYIITVGVLRSQAYHPFRVKAASVNPVDTKVRKGTYDNYPGQLL